MREYQHQELKVKNIMWIETNKRRLFFDMHLPDWPEKGVAGNFNPREIVEVFSRSNIDSVILYAKCQYGNFYYNTEIGYKHRGLGDIDFFNDVKKGLTRNGIKVIAYYSVSWDEKMASEHPEWRVRNPEGHFGAREFRWKTLCVNSPYRDVVKSHLKEIAQKTTPDGFWIDMTIIGSDSCYCSYCQGKYHNLFGRNIPKSNEDPDYLNFIQFRYDYIEEFYSEIRDLIKEIKPEIQITFNYWGYPYSSSENGSRAIGALSSTDFVTGEAYTDWTGLNAPSFFTRFLRGAALGKPYEVLIGRFINTWDYTKKSREQLAFEAYSVVAHGGTVTIDDEPYHNGSLDLGLYREIEEIYGEIKRRELYIKGRPSRFSAIYHSQKSKDYYFEQGNEEFIRSQAGAFKMMRDLHFPLDFVFDEAFSRVDFSTFKVIILPSVAILSREEMESLCRYIEEGGVVIGAGPVSISEIKNGQSFENLSLLNEIFGISSHGLSSFSMSYMRHPDFPDRDILVKGKYVRYSDIGFVHVPVVDPICETTSESFFHNNLPSPHKLTDYPAVLQKKIGKGTLILFAQPVFSHYGKQNQKELRMIVKNLISESAGLPAVRFECPARVDVSVMEGEGELIVHLLNPNPGIPVCCGLMDPFEGAYPRTFEYMDEILPVSDIKILINSNKVKVYSVETVGEKNSVHWNSEKGDTIIRLEKLNLWETIKVKLN